MKKLCVCFAAAALAAVGFAGQPDEKVSAPQLPGRSETNVVIKIKDKGEFSMKYPAYPYVDTNGCVSILPGESHVIEFDVKDGQPVNPRWVKTQTKGNHAITLKFTNDGEMAMLMTKNLCAKIITMKCRHQVAGKQGLFETGINPIEPGLYSFDSWPPQSVSLLLFDFRFWDDYDKAFKHER